MIKQSNHFNEISIIPVNIFNYICIIYIYSNLHKTFFNGKSQSTLESFKHHLKQLVEKFCEKII